MWYNEWLDKYAANDQIERLEDAWDEVRLVEGPKLKLSEQGLFWKRIA